MTDYLTTGDVLSIHQDQIRRCGGAAGVRDHQQVIDFVLTLYATHQFQFANLAPWLRENVVSN